MNAWQPSFSFSPTYRLKCVKMSFDVTFLSLIINGPSLLRSNVLSVFKCTLKVKKNAFFEAQNRL